MWTGHTIPFEQVINNASGLRRIWIIFWCTRIFEAGGLCLNPTKSYVRSIRLDGSREISAFRQEKTIAEARHFEGGLPEEPEVKVDAVASIRAYLKVPLRVQAVGGE